MKSDARLTQLDLFSEAELREPAASAKPVSAPVASLHALSFKEFPSQVLARDLPARLGIPVSLRTNCNQRTMLSCKRKTFGLEECAQNPRGAP